jgi:hypothetical protein
VSGALSTSREIKSENMQTAAKRTAKEITDLLEKGFVKHGWNQAK